MLDKVLKKLAQEETIVSETVKDLPAMEAVSEIDVDEKVNVDADPENAWPKAATPEEVIPYEKQAALREFIKVAKEDLKEKSQKAYLMMAGALDDEEKLKRYADTVGSVDGGKMLTSLLERHRNMPIRYGYTTHKEHGKIPLFATRSQLERIRDYYRANLPALGPVRGNPPGGLKALGEAAAKRKLAKESAVQEAFLLGFLSNNTNINK